MGVGDVRWAGVGVVLEVDQVLPRHEPTVAARLVATGLTLLLLSGRDVVRAAAAVLDQHLVGFLVCVYYVSSKVHPYVVRISVDLVSLTLWLLGLHFGCLVASVTLRVAWPVLIAFLLCLCHFAIPFCHLRASSTMIFPPPHGRCCERRWSD